MNIEVSKGLIVTEQTDLLVVTALEGATKLSGTAAEVNELLDGALFEAMNEDQYKASVGATYVFRTGGVLPAKRVLVIGMGKKKEIDVEHVRVAGAHVASAAKRVGAETVVLGPIGTEFDLDPAACAQACVEGMMLGSYRFDGYKKAPEKEPTEVQDVRILVDDGKLTRPIKKGIELGTLLARGTMMARDLVNTPAGDMHPEALVKMAKEIAKGNPRISCKVYDKAALEKMGAGGILGVGQGSDHPPYMVHLTYTPEKATKKSVALVGKAVTFDSGGLSLKPAQYMETMKVDMGGSAAVLGAFSVLSEVAPKVKVHGIIAPVENMPSGKAVRPGDVLTAMNGKTVEVLNTDAEGRLTLMDALSYAEKQEPQAIIDLATLTGACVVALGEEITGLMSNNDALAEKVLSAAKQSGENVWRLPLEKSYNKLLKSPVADLKNIGGRYGGALTAGLFLQNFVEKTPWVHLDIAGPAFSERDVNAYTKRGAAGTGVRMLLTYLKSL